MKTIPPFRLKPEPLNEAPKNLPKFKWAGDNIGTRHQLGGEPSLFRISFALIVGRPQNLQSATNCKNGEFAAQCLNGCALLVIGRFCSAAAFAKDLHLRFQGGNFPFHPVDL